MRFLGYLTLKSLASRNRPLRPRFSWFQCYKATDSLLPGRKASPPQGFPGYQFMQLGGESSDIMKCKLKHFVLGKKCEKPLDVVFVLDSSEKVGTENWKKIVNTTIDIASEFDIKTARFAAVQYTNFPETPIKLISFKDDKSFGETLKKVFYKTGGKRTDLALNSTLGVFKAASPRPGSKVLSEKHIRILAGRQDKRRKEASAGNNFQMTSSTPMSLHTMLVPGQP